jgi:hypothetical protein
LVKNKTRLVRVLFFGLARGSLELGQLKRPVLTATIRKMPSNAR